MWSSRAGIALAIVVATGAVAGCGGDDEQGGTASTAGSTPTAEAAGPRTTTVTASGTPVAVRTARVVIPPGWTKNEALASRTTAGQDAAAEASAWVRGEAKGRPSQAIIVLAVPEKGAEQAAKERTAEYAKAVKGGFDRTSGLPASASRIAPATTLGGRTAAKVTADADRGSVRFLAAGRGDESYGVTVIGQAGDGAELDATLAELEKSWSWTP